jgi:hypothetical protein
MKFGCIDFSANHHSCEESAVHPQLEQNHANENLKQLKDDDLVTLTKSLVGEEVRITARVIECFEELERRRLYLELGYPSLFDYAVRALGYAESSAQRRIAAMRVIRELPELKAQVETGELKLTTLSRAYTFFRQEKKQDNDYSTAEKRYLLNQLKDQSSREVERTLASLNPACVPAERTRPVSATQTEIRFVADEQLLNDLQRLKDLWAHVEDDMSYSKLIQRMARLALEKCDPLRQKRGRKGSEAQATSGGTPSPGTSLPAPEVKLPKEEVMQQEDAKHEDISSQGPRFPSGNLRKEVWRRDQGMCAYEDPVTGKRCSTNYALQVDHIQPYCDGGVTVSHNLRLLCRAHNQHLARKGRPVRT